MEGLAKYGPYAFMAGLLIAIVAGLGLSVLTEWASMIALALLVLGLIVGLLNVTDKEMMLFLVAGIALTVGLGSLGTLATDLSLPFLKGIFNNIALFVGPAIGVASLKAIISITKD